MSRKRLRYCVAPAVAIALIGASVASAHQTLVNNGVAVTLHVTPNDEPVAGEIAQVLVPKVKTRTGKFSWATCRCTIVISDSAKKVLLNSAAAPRTEFTFPEAAAYKIEIAGRVLRKGKWATFKVAFGIRAA